MIISLKKIQTGQEFIKEMEKRHGSYNELKKKFKRTNNMIFLIDLEALEYHKKNPNETIERTNSIITDELTLGEIEIELLNTIKNNHPKSIRELARLSNKDISVVQPKVKNLHQEGLIKIKEGIRNSKIPVVNFDEIVISL
ncbi:MAG: hypothetical protein LBM96_04375 [Methanobrevibacter sp.]|jgi:DNA-binding MarR family transcriptional regulator|nr:hypothetical protein [Candidatus Methanoflexus mossambicus]